jgi:hypothetical protein
MPKIRSIYLFPVAALLALVASATAWSAIAAGQEAQPDRQLGETCTAATLRGSYALRDAGVGFKPDGTHAVEFAGTGVEFFDGAGGTHGTFTSTNSQVGAIAGTFTGTYSVHADCTGSKDLTFSLTQPAGLTGKTQGHYEFVLIDGGRGLLDHGTEPALNTVEQGQLVRQ